MKISAFIILSLAMLALNVKNECTDFQKGTFQLNSSSGNSYIIIRKGNKQIEHAKKTETISEYDIRWIDDCTYLLFNRKVVKGNDLYPESNSDTLYCQIVEINGNFFKVKSSLRGYDFEAASVLQKIK